MKQRAVALALVATSIGLVLGFLLKDQCTRHDWDGWQYRRSCYTDILALYSARGLDREPVPYINGDGVLSEPEAGDLEYPVGTGYFIAAVASLVDDGVSFFRASAIGLGLAGLATGAALALIADRRRLLLFALGPPLILYAFHNWDLLAVLALVIALVAFVRNADGTAGAAIGFGAATKLFPAVVVPVLVAVRMRRDGVVPWRLVAWSAGAFAAWNVPVMLANPAGWWFPWDFQSSRLPNFETSWYFVLRHLRGVVGTDAFWFDRYGSLASGLSTALFVAGMAFFLRAAWRRDHMQPFALSLGALAIFLLTAKVYSPQYALWLLPLFVLVRLPWQAYAAFVVTDAFVWFAVAAFLLNFDAPTSGYLNLLEVAVVVRYLVLGWLVWLCLRVRDVTSEEPRPAGVQHHA